MPSTRTAEISLREAIIVVTIQPGVTQTLADAEENYSSVVRLSGSRPCPLLIDMRSAAPLTADARHFYAAKRMDDAFTCLGLLLHASPVGKMLGNVYFQIARHKIPVRLFTEEEAAWAWLRSNKR